MLSTAAASQGSRFQSREGPDATTTLIIIIIVLSQRLLLHTIKLIIRMTPSQMTETQNCFMVSKVVAPYKDETFSDYSENT